MDPNPPVWVMFAPYDEAAASECLVLARTLRSWGVPAEVDGRSVRLRKKLERAITMQCYFIVILGPDDFAKGTAQIRDVDESAFGKPVSHEIPIATLDGWIAEQLLGPRDLRDARVRREQECDELSPLVTQAIVEAENASDPVLWDRVAQLEAALISVTAPGSHEREIARRGVVSAQASAAALRTPSEVYQIQAQIRGFKNKLHHVRATSFADAREQARAFFGENWVFRIEVQNEAGGVEIDPGFDPAWEED